MPLPTIAAAETSADPVTVHSKIMRRHGRGTLGRNNITHMQIGIILPDAPWRHPIRVAARDPRRMLPLRVRVLPAAERVEAARIRIDA